MTSKEYETDLYREAVSAWTPPRDKHQRQTKAAAVLLRLVVKRWPQGLKKKQKLFTDSFTESKKTEK